MLLNSLSTVTLYEFPLNERLRTMLRLETLLARIAYFLDRPHPYDHHALILHLFEVLEIVTRIEIKTELLQELERQRSVLNTFLDDPLIDSTRVKNLLGDIDQVYTAIHQTGGKLGQHLRANDWLMSIKQRTAIPGGICEFNLPHYHQWLHEPNNTRRAQLQEWIAPFLTVQRAIQILLKLLRSSGGTERYCATRGQLQITPAGRTIHMLRLKVERSLTCAPEISANRYAIHIRFTEFQNEPRARIVNEDVDFLMTLCSL